MDLQKLRDDAKSYAKIAGYFLMAGAAFGMGWIAHSWWG